jgi:hypothetical protein
MAVTFQRAQGFASGFTNAPNLTSAIADSGSSLALGIWYYRNNDAAALTVNTRNSVGFTSVFVSTDGIGGKLELFRQTPSVGTFTANASLNVFKNTAAGWLVFGGSDAGTPIGTVSYQNENTVSAPWAAPSLTPSSAPDDLIVSVLALFNWDSGFGSTASATVTNGGSQTARLDQTFDGGAPQSGTPRFIVTTAPAGSTVSYTFSGGLQPMYEHWAFAVKDSAGGGPTPAPSFGRYGVRGPVR